MGALLSRPFTDQANHQYSVSRAFVGCYWLIAPLPLLSNKQSPQKHQDVFSEREARVRLCARNSYSFLLCVSGRPAQLQLSPGTHVASDV